MIARYIQPTLHENRISINVCDMVELIYWKIIIFNNLNIGLDYND